MQIQSHNMTVEFTEDYPLIAKIINHPLIRKMSDDDFCIGDIPIKKYDGVSWILVKDSENPVGVFALISRGSVCYEVHTCLLPKVWGSISEDIGMKLISFVFTNTVCQKIITSVPESNRLALRYAKAMSLKEEGINRKSFLLNGVLEDMIMLGITKEEGKCL